MSQDELRKQVKYLIEFYGSTQQFIGKNIGVSRSTINLFIKNERNLALQVEQRLKDFLKTRIK